MKEPFMMGLVVESPKRVDRHTLRQERPPPHRRVGKLEKPFHTL
jgi:hypothetical protein